MQLKELLSGIEYLHFQGSDRVEVTGLTYDSRRVKPGDIFVAIIGFQQDGHDYLSQARERGARAVVVEREIEFNSGVSVIRVRDSRLALAELSNIFYGHPSQRLQLIGVTGTNGKTTTTYLIEALLRQAGFKTGLMGTIANRIGEQRYRTERTTPEAPEIQSFLATMLKQGVSHAVMEVSSHALQLKRVEGLEFDCAVFTNISQDHLDFHPSLDDYLKTKTLLFQSLAADKRAVINMDDPRSGYILNQLEASPLTYGIEQEADLRAQRITVSRQGVEMTVITPVGEIELNLKLSGLFNVYNALAAVGVGLVYDLGLEEIKVALEKVGGVAGRFELVDCGQDFGVVVDYAHTPDGMENILQTARELTEGKRIIVFGCGGDRDRKKRPLMGRVAARYGDLVIVTSDNPRSEDPALIIEEIIAGIKELSFPDNKYRVVKDREAAIREAISAADSGDLVFIIGKGHETYQELKDRTIPFDDREVARRLLNKRLGQ